MKNLVLVTMMAASLSACVSNKKDKANTAAAQSAGYASGQSDAQSNAVKAANFMISLEANSPTSNYAVVKFAQGNANFVVISYDNGGTTGYGAVDISSYVAGSSTSTYMYGADGRVYDHLTANGDGTFKCAAGCITVSGGSLAAGNTSMVFEKTAGASKDMDKAAAFIEQAKSENLAAALAANYGLSDDRSLQVAKLASAWNKLSQSRALTDADADAFAQQLAGVSMSEINTAEKALVGGSMAEMNAIVAKAAAVNGTTSENMSAIMDKLFQ